LEEKIMSRKILKIVGYTLCAIPFIFMVIAMIKVAIEVPEMALFFALLISFTSGIVLLGMASK
jgi:hypothetical protein